MRNKILLSMLIIALAGAPIYFIENGTNAAEKYAALKQVNNSEMDYQEYKALGNLHSVKYFIIVIAAFGIGAIWKPKKTQTPSA